PVKRTLADRDSKMDTCNGARGATVSRVDLNARLLGPGANSDMLGLYFGDQNQHFDFNTSQDHIAPNTGSDLLYKGALDGASRGVFRGIIRVHPGAQRTDAYQTNRNLLLSSEARADSLPNLEIEADDVKCSHGATVGELDADARFYLMSRGLDRISAERLVVLGFLGEVLGRLPLGGVSEKVTRVIEEKLRGHVARTEEGAGGRRRAGVGARGRPGPVSGRGAEGRDGGRPAGRAVQRRGAHPRARGPVLARGLAPLGRGARRRRGGLPLPRRPLRRVHGGTPGASGDPARAGVPGRGARRRHLGAGRMSAPADVATLDVTEVRSRFPALRQEDRKSTRLNSSHVKISYAVFCL